jgi:hypothetical protein
MMSAWAIVALLLSAFGTGRLILLATDGRGREDLESRALAIAAGLGAIALLLGGLGLLGHLAWARWILPAGALVTLIVHVPQVRSLRLGNWRSLTLTAVVAVVMVLAAGVGALAPITEFDSLCYPLPIARHLVQDGAWAFWPDQARSAFPLSQELLIAPLMIAGSQTLGVLSAAELALAACLIVALARRVTRHQDAPWIAVIIALGCPAVAFLAASAKEDLLVLVMTTAAAVSLVSTPGSGAAVRVGLFAGFAVGAKLTGVPVALAIVACVPFCCGREQRVVHTAVAAYVAVLACGLWFLVNWVRFENPLPLLSLGPAFGAPLMAPEVMAEWADGFGTGRTVLDAVVAPWHMSLGSELFGGRGNWINPLAFLGVAAMFMPGARREVRVLIAIAVAGYVGWFAQIQVARLLLPALVLLSVPAADMLAVLGARWRVARALVAIVLVLSAGVVASVGVIRMHRYSTDPDRFLSRETPHYDDLQWMNTHLDPKRDRVASAFEANGYLQIPWFTLNGTYQIAIRPDETIDPDRLRAALDREHVTHLFGPPDAFSDLARSLKLVYENPASRVGGSSFFRSPRSEPTAIFKVLPIASPIANLSKPVSK